MTTNNSASPPASRDDAERLERAEQYRAFTQDWNLNGSCSEALWRAIDASLAATQERHDNLEADYLNNLGLLESVKSALAASNAERDRLVVIANDAIDARDAANAKIARLRTVLQRVQTAMFFDLRRMVVNDGSGYFNQAVSDVANAVAAALASPQPDAKKCAHTNIDKYGQCEMCGQWGSFAQPDAKTRGNPYGYCPICGAPGVTRERSPNGNTRCERGHEYPSRDAKPSPSPEAAPPEQELPNARMVSDNSVVSSGSVSPGDDIPASIIEAAPPSAEDVDRAQWLWDNLPLRKHENKAQWLKVAASVSVAAHQAGVRAGREQMREEAAQIAEEAWGELSRVTATRIRALAPDTKEKLDE